MNRVRCFIAIELTEDVKQALLAVQETLKRAMPRTLSSSARWVAPENIHLTLKFIGAVPEDRVSEIEQALELRLSGAKSCDLRIRGIGMFPSRTRPRVIWAGVEGRLDALADLQRRVEDATVPLGFPREARPFSPHLTLARVSDDAEGSQRATLGSIIAATKVDMDRVVLVEHVTLMRSELRQSGARYSRIAEVNLRIS